MALRRLLPLLLLTACGADNDGDGFAGARDCHDDDASSNPTAVEVCDGRDNDCDGQIDEGVALVAFWDRDGDGFGDSAFARRVCELAEDGSLEEGDCDDLDAESFPGAPEVCDGADNDCNGEPDDGVTLTFYEDADGDGHGDGVNGATLEACTPPTGFSRTADDCDDAEPLAWGGAAESCDGVDNDCNGEVDEGLPQRLLQVDGDGDGFGDPNSTAPGCGPSDGLADNGLDCNDSDPDESPDATELAGNGADEDCDGFVDELAVPDHYATVEAALAVAGTGDVVQLGEGLFTASLDLTGFDVTLAGEGCGRTLVYADGAGPAVTMDGGTVEGLTLSGGAAGGLLVLGDLTAREICVEGNVNARAGGGIELDAGLLILEDSLIADNRSQLDGGGIDVGPDATLEATRVRFLDNYARFDGGGLSIRGGEANVTASIFARNTAYDDGGAVAAKRPVGAVNPVVTLTNLTFDDNIVEYDLNVPTGTASLGTAIYLSYAEATVDNCLFTHHDQPDEQLMALATVSGSLVVGAVGMYGNGDRDLDDGWVLSAVRGQPRYASRHPSGNVRHDDFRLLEGSPFIDVGNPAIPDAGGGPSDLGAYGGPDALPGWDDGIVLDADLDGLPDLWERDVGLEEWRDDAAEDPDGDGLDNLGEFAAGSDPIDHDADGDGVLDGAEVERDEDPVGAYDHGPVAWAPADRWVLPGEVVTLDAGASFDPAREAITWSWFVSAPGGSGVVTVDDPSAAVATFTPDVAGTYALSLIVSDGHTSDTAEVSVRAVNATVVPDDEPTLSGAVDNAADGDVIALRPGMYPDEVLVTGRLLSIVGLGAPEDVVIDGIGGGVILVLNASELELRSLTVTGGSALKGGAVRAEDSDLVLYDVVLRGNVAALDGGAVSCDGGSLVADRLVVRDNVAGIDGGGIDVHLAEVELDHVRLWDNEADRYGGGLHVDNVQQQLRVSNAVLQGNTAEEGAAVWFSGSNDARFRGLLEQTAIVDNVAVEHVVFADKGHLMVLDSLLVANEGAALFGASSGARVGWLYTLYPAMWGNSAPEFAPEVEAPPIVYRSDPRVLAFFDDGDPANDQFTLKVDSPLLHTGHPDRRDADGARASVGPAGGWRAGASALWDHADAERDGMSDGWETRYGLDPSVDDGGLDCDGDGVSNLAEHEAGTPPC